MRNSDTRMTGGVLTCFCRQRRNWSLLSKTRSVVVAVALCLATYSVIGPKLLAAPQQNPATATNSQRVSTAAVITAKPERVTQSDGNGSTEIKWDTGNGSMGF